MMDYINAGYEPFLMTFMFNQMHGGEARKTQRMISHIERFYGRLLTRIVRNSEKEAVYGSYPILLGAPDWPVHSHLKMSLEDCALNEGKHWHGIFLMPPRSRLWQPLHEHLTQKQGKYAGPSLPIMRIHTVPIETSARKAIGYALKQIDRRRVDQDALVILPKTKSEMPGQSRA